MIARSSITIIFDMIIIFNISWQLSSIALAGVIIAGGLQGFFMQRQKDIQKKIQGLRADLTVNAEEVCTNIRTVKAFSSED